jgi:hypothetical protein
VEEKCPKCGKPKYPKSGQKPKVFKRVLNRSQFKAVLKTL